MGIIKKQYKFMILFKKDLILILKYFDLNLDDCMVYENLNKQ